LKKPLKINNPKN